jgi:predicted histone-like DNA-binding protein
MSLFYNKAQRANPLHPEDIRLWFIFLKSIGQIGEKEVAKLLSDETTLNRKEAEMALAQFEKILIRLLLDGHSVQLGDWGSFYLTCSCKGSETKEGATVHNIKELKIRFVPGKALKAALKDATFLAAESLVI